MIRKILNLFGIGLMVTTQVNALELPKPYKEDSVNFMYNLLFCDDASLFKKVNDEKSAYWEDVLFLKPNEKSVRVLAENIEEESRVRILAYNWLRENKSTITKGILLGVIIEVPLEGGLDTLAAYSDGRVRYINQAGKLVVVELGGSAEIENLAKELVGVSISVVKKIGPWEHGRLPPPVKGNIRMTFLASDGLYFGEGPRAIMQKDPTAAPVINKAVQLLQAVVNKALENQT
jgi:hypothetical protein